MKWFARAARLVLVAAPLALSGCGDRPPDNGVVRGRVTLGGRPVAGVSVTVYDPATRAGVQAETGPDGEYEIRSHQDAGLPPGKYQVSVSPRTGFATAEDQAAALSKSLQGGGGSFGSSGTGATVPSVYHDPAASGLQIEVVSGDNPPFNFELVPGK
jgi:hypothetical protein